ncbi:unnamed protein product, partial [Polarella glacialis]
VEHGTKVQKMLRRSLVWLAVLSVAAWALPAVIRPGDRRIYVDGKPLHMKGINWNPVDLGLTHPAGIRFLQNVEKDARLMAEAGINMIRTYEVINDTAVLDVLWKNGIQVLNTIYANGASPLNSLGHQVDSVKHHPAILMWVVGNEWNYNKCYCENQGMSLGDCATKLEQAAQLIKEHDSAHPVASVYGEVPPQDVINRLSSVDVWGINYYDELSFGTLFQRWAERSSKPMFIGEYGADAYDATQDAVNEDAQAHATKILTQQIMENSAVWDSGVCSGGLIFEFADEWWKDQTGSLNVQDIGGIAPGGGPHPDRTFNEEWWGLLTLDRKPRKAYFAYAALAIPQPQLALKLMSVGGNATEGLYRSCTAGGCTLVPRKREDSK